MPRLYTRVYLHLVGVLVVAGLLTSLVFALGPRPAFLRELGHRLARHATALVAEDLGRPEALARRVAQIHRDLDVNLRVVDLEGRELARAGSEVPPLDREEVARARGGAIVVRPRREWVVAAPIREPPSGAIVALLEAAGRPALREPAPWRPLAAAGLLLGVVALAALPLARRISRPLEGLTEAARRLGAGDLSARVAMRPPRRWWRRRHRPGDEIEELTGTFNEMAARVERLVRGQKELLANVSHDLRSPLARMRMALELLPLAADGEARRRDLEADLAELERLVDDVLTASRLDATGVPPHPEPVLVDHLLGGVARRAHRDPRTAGLPVEMSAPPGLEIVADGALLERALWNLVENAAKYGAPPIALTAAQQGDLVHLAVSDLGPGIPPAERERVLDPFYRADRARTPGAAAGFGLGLALARRIAEVHGGSIAIGPHEVEGERERGCRVTLSLPVRPGGNPAG